MSQERASTSDDGKIDKTNSHQDHASTSDDGKLDKTESQTNKETTGGEEEAPAPLIEDLLIDYGKPWFMVPHLLRLNVVVFLITLSATNNGYDGSMLNGLQSLSNWHNYMEKSVKRPLSGAILGALTSGSVFGGFVAFFFSSYLSDRFGRRNAIFSGQLILIVGAILQGASNGYPLFLMGRFILGLGSNIAGIASPTLISEVAYPTHRPVATTCYNTCWYLGLVIASWITYGTRNISSHYSWRIPSYIQAACPLVQIVTIWMIPESPRFLINKGRIEKARQVLLKHHAGGDEVRGKLLVDFEIAEIQQSLEMDRIYSQTKYTDFLKTPANRRRLFYCCMIPFMMQMSGNGLVSYYLNLVLNSIGITSTDSQLILNGGLMIYNLGCACIIAFCANLFKRRTMFLFSLSMMLVCYVIWTILSAINQQRNFEQKLLGQGVLAMIFLYYLGYNIGLNGVPYLYITEVLTYNLRAKGVNLMNLAAQFTLIYNAFVNPVAMDAIEWKYYIVYDCIVAVELVIVYFTFVETAGFSLEEVCIAFGEDINNIPAEQLGIRNIEHKSEVTHVESV